MKSKSYQAKNDIYNNYLFSNNIFTFVSKQSQNSKQNNLNKNNMKLEWDSNKNNSNIEKHGIDFSDLTKAFTLPMLKREDNRQDYGEKRWIALVELHEICIVIVYSVRKNTMRIISARKANKKERKIYHEKIGKNKLG